MTVYELDEASGAETRPPPLPLPLPLQNLRRRALSAWALAPRDASLRCAAPRSEDGRVITPREYLETALRLAPGDNAAVQSKNQARHPPIDLCT